MSRRRQFSTLEEAWDSYHRAVLPLATDTQLAVFRICFMSGAVAAVEMIDCDHDEALVDGVAAFGDEMRRLVLISKPAMGEA